MQTVDRPCETPVLLMTFRRPETTVRVFEAIRKARPKALYVAANAPRPGNAVEADQCKAVRKIVQAVDWDCSLHTLFRDEHLDVATSVSSAIDWFFDAVDAGIILEDDCLPHATFFRFCGEMLDRYRDATNVMQVAGYNFLSGRYEMDFDYLFSNFGWQWGWATWRRAWRCYDLKMSSWPEFKRIGLHKQFPFYSERVQTFDRTYAGAVTTWDFQWHFAVASNSGLSVVPKYSLTENIGFGINATHGTKAAAYERFLVPVRPMSFPISHYPFLFADHRYDQMLIREAHYRSIVARARSFVSVMLRRLHLR
jgi:hypothetical protein